MPQAQPAYATGVSWPSPPSRLPASRRRHVRWVPLRPLRDWLTNWLDRQPSFDVKIRTRQDRSRKLYCKACGSAATQCLRCNAPLVAAVEKGVDAALVTDLLSHAWQRSYDVAVLVSGDADYVPAVEYVQAQGLKVVNAAWRSRGHELRTACWGSFDIDAVVPQLKR